MSARTALLLAVGLALSTSACRRETAAAVVATVARTDRRASWPDPSCRNGVSSIGVGAAAWSAGHLPMRTLIGGWVFVGSGAGPTPFTHRYPAGIAV